MLDPDERMRVADGVWAIGDITGKGAFTHVSMYQGAVVVNDLLGRDGPWADYRAVSRVTFTAPEVASVGLSEKAARDVGRRRGRRHRRPRRSRLDGPRGRSDQAGRRPRRARCWSGRVVVGPAGGEIMSMLALAVHAEVPIATLLHSTSPTRRTTAPTRRS